MSVEVSGKRGIAGMKFRGVTPDATYLHFEDKPRFEEVEVLATKYLNDYLTGKIDRLDVAYTKFENIARQHAVVEKTLLPLAAIDGLEKPGAESAAAEGAKTAKAEVQYEFLPSPRAFLRKSYRRVSK